MNTHEDKPHTTMAQQAINYASITFDGDLFGGAPEATPHLLDVINMDDLFPDVTGFSKEDDEGMYILVKFPDESSISFIGSEDASTIWIMQHDDKEEYVRDLFKIVIGGGGQSMASVVKRLVIAKAADAIANPVDGGQ